MAKSPQLMPLAFEGSVRLEANLLKDQATDLLRNQIVTGRIPPGTKLVEREVAELLGISRVPVRDALNELQKEGLVISRSNGRYVIQLSERDVRELYQVRLALEKLAVELAARNTSSENRLALLTNFEEMQQAITRKDARGYIQSDVDTHRLIWRQADNDHLLTVLNSMVGPIFMFVATNSEQFDWSETLDLHQDLVRCVNAGDPASAVKSIEKHLDTALHRSLQIFQRPESTVSLRSSQSI